jgi:hypothetical protein
MRVARLAERGFLRCGDLAEIAALSAGETAVEVLCVIDPEQARCRCGGLAIVPDLAAALSRAGAKGLDGIIVTDTRAPQAMFDNLCRPPS